MVQIGNEWDDILKDEFSADYFQKIQQTLEEEYAAYEIFPPKADIFNALKYTPYSNIKAVLLGQDPYHGPGQAHGLCFSVQPGVTRRPVSAISSRSWKPIWESKSQSTAA